MQHVEPAEPIDRKFDHRFDLARIAHVGLQVSCRRPDLARDPDATRVVDIRDNDLGALGREQPRGRGADSRRGPRNHRDFAVEFAHLSTCLCGFRKAGIAIG